MVIKKTSSPVESSLKKDEIILWQGAPVVELRFNPHDKLSLFTSVVGISFFSYILMAYYLPKNNIDMFSLIMIAIFITQIIYLFSTKKYCLRNTKYYLTNYKYIITYGSKKNKIYSENWTHIEKVSVKRKNGRGNIIFGKPYLFSMYSPGPLLSFLNLGMSTAYIFENVPNINSAVKILEDVIDQKTHLTIGST
jgi:hypothetical protein